MLFLNSIFLSRLRLVYWLTLNIANDLRIFASYYAFAIVSLTWLAYFLSRYYLSSINLIGSIYFLFLSDKGPMLETLDYTICIDSTPTCLYFDLYLYSAYAAHYVYCLSILGIHILSFLSHSDDWRVFYWNISFLYQISQKLSKVRYENY